MSNNVFINKQIKKPFIFLIMPDGSKKENIKIEEAIVIAEGMGLDVIQVSEHSSGLPICKIADYGKIKYMESKNKKVSHNIEKEIKIRYNISANDLNVKVKKIEEFLLKEYKVKVSMDYREARTLRTYEKVNHFNNLISRFSENSSFSKTDVRGSFISVVLMPKKK
jgi:translation initiation factor IF-3